jgi:hypothetical protein
MTDDVRKLLEDLRHDLVTMNGMGAFDRVAPNITFTVDNSKLIRRIEEILGDQPQSEELQPGVNFGDQVDFGAERSGEEWKGDNDAES